MKPEQKPSPQASSPRSDTRTMQFEEEYRRGELQEMCRAMLPFFLRNLADFRAFSREWTERFHGLDFLFLLKLYVLNKNMPFDMAQYIQTQKRNIESKAQLAHLPEAVRQEAVSDWIAKHAQEHRKDAILRQIFCIEKMAATIVPAIQEQLGKTLLEQPVKAI
jgi:hypothetical protein